MKFVKFFVLTLLCVGLIAGTVLAQRQTGNIKGTAADADGVPLPGVTVEISSPSLMGVQSQVTSAKGNYRFINLPPGTYKLVFNLEGFQTLERENVRVSVAKTVTVNIVLQQATLEESVTVTAAAPIVDVEQSGLSHIYDRDELEKLPIGRNSIFDVIKFAPGLSQTWQESSWSVAHGSSSGSNIYQMDGVELSSTWAGGSWLDVTAEAFEEVETFGVGAPAEYGQFTGAVVNIVTKSGSNSFHGTLSYYGQFQGLTDDNNPWKVLDPSVPPEEAGNYPDSAYSFQIDKYLSASVNLGGPVFKDRLWFYGTYERQDDSKNWWNMYPGYAVNYPSNKVYFKLTGQLASRHKLTGSIYWEDFEYPDYPYYWIAPSSWATDSGSTFSWNLLYTFQLSNSAWIDLKYAGYDAKEEYYPQSGDWETPPRREPWTDGSVTGGMNGQAWWWNVSRHQAHANLTYFAEDFLAGDHEFKIGAQYYRGDQRYPIGYIGEVVYYDWYGDPWYLYQRDVFYAGGIVDSFAAFVDDSWKIGDRLTLNLGFRFDYSNGWVPELPVMDYFTPTSETTPAVKDMVTWNSFSPRIGLVYQLTPDQKTLLKASYGRYYDALLMADWSDPGPNVTPWNVYYYDYDIDEWVFWYSYFSGSAFIMDPDLKNPYADMFSIGLERELLPDFAVGLSYIYKKHNDLLGLEARGGIYEEVSMVSEDNGQTYTVFNQLNKGDEEIWMTNPSNYDQVYNAVMLTLKKRYSQNWMLNASLTYSKSEGMTTIGHSTSARQLATVSRGGDYGEDPNDLINARGRMNLDRPWVLKVQAGYTFPWDILASFNYIYQTGRPNPSFTRFRLNQGSRSILTAPRGDDRFPNWMMLDFRLEKAFNIGDRVKFHTMFDVFNVLNANTTTYYVSHSMYRSTYQEPEWIFYPRRLQIGLKLQF